MELMGMAEVAQCLGVTRQRVSQLRKEANGSPAPLDTLTMGAVWSGEEIRTWAANERARRNKPIRPVRPGGIKRQKSVEELQASIVRPQTKAQRGAAQRVASTTANKPVLPDLGQDFYNLLDSLDLDETG